MRDHVAKALTLIFTLLFQLSAIADEQVTQELNATWAKMSKAVAEGDLASYRAAFHPYAILLLFDNLYCLHVDQQTVFHLVCEQTTCN